MFIKLVIPQESDYGHKFPIVNYIVLVYLKKILAVGGCSQ